MPKKFETKRVTLEEFIERVKKYLKIIVQELKGQKEHLERLEKNVETLKAEVDTIKAKLSRIERRAMPAIPPTPSAPEEAIGTELDMVLPEVPSIEELEAPRTEAKIEGAEAQEKAESLPVPPVPSITEERKEVSVSTEKGKVEEEFDLEKYLERLEQLEGLEKLEVPEVPSAEEIAIPEVSPDTEEGKPVSPKELKKKEKDILKALSELEFA